MCLYCVDAAELPPLRLAPEKGGQENSSKKLIEELSSQMAASESNGVKVPEHLVCIKEADSSHPQRVHMKVNLPGVRSVAEVELEVSSVSWSSFNTQFTEDQNSYKKLHPVHSHKTVHSCIRVATAMP